MFMSLVYEQAIDYAPLYLLHCPLQVSCLMRVAEGRGEAYGYTIAGEMADHIWQETRSPSLLTLFSPMDHYIDYVTNNSDE